MSDLSILLPINHNRLQYVEKITPLETLSKVKKFLTFWKFHGFAGLVVVNLVIVINSVIGGFSRVDLAALTICPLTGVRLHPITICDYNSTE